MKSLTLKLNGDFTHDAEIDDEEYSRWKKTKELPLKTKNNCSVWFDDDLRLHRDNNLPAWINNKDGYEEYRVNGKLHRTN